MLDGGKREARCVRNATPIMLRHCPWPERPAIMKLEFSRWLGRGWTWNAYPLKYHCFCKRWNNCREKDRPDEQRERERDGSDRVPDIVRYNENMAATWKSSMALLWRSGSTCKTLLSKGKKGERISAIRIIDLQSLIFCNFNDSSRICVIFRDRFFFTRARFKFIFAIHY